MLGGSQTSSARINPEEKPGQRWTLPGFDLVPLVGIELTTYRLQGGCSTN
jgi:hypothetical protein